MGRPGRPKLTEEERKISEARRREKQKEYMKRYRSRPEIKAEIREQNRRWRKANPEKQTAILARYYTKKAIRMQEESRAANP